MPTPVLARSAAVLAAVALGIAAVPELTEASPAASAAAAGPAAALAPAVVRAVPVASRPVAPDRARYDRILPRDLSGKRVLDSQAALVPEIADRSNVPVHRMAQMLQDPTVRVAPQGRAYVIEEPFVADEPRAAGSTTGSDDDAASEAEGSLGSVPKLGGGYTDADTFNLESRPGATRSIILDANGATVSSDFWDEGASGTWAGYDQDGKPATFSSSELAFIRQVWRQVADAYAPFDVNVTTRDLPRAAWQRDSAADTTYGTRVVLTSSAAPHLALCGGGCAGVAPLGTFGEIDKTDGLQPAWVFVGDMVGEPTIAAQTVSHEVGHTVGLDHDGQNGEEYTFGSERWGPIMGGSTQRAVSQWSKGEYAGSTSTEDDLGIITAHNLPLVTDDYLDTTGGAAPLGTKTAYDVEGVISTRTDVDVFKLDVPCTLSLDARAMGIGPQGTLDLKLDLLSSAGAVLASNSPTTTHDENTWDMATNSSKAVGMDAALTRSLTPGTYYLRVDGVGSGDGTKADMLGWTDYGSLGRYRLTANGCATTTPPTTAPPTTAPPTTAPPTTTPPTTTPPTTKPPTTAPPTTTVPTTTTPTTKPPATAPGAPTLGTVTSGMRGRPISVTMSWTAPTSTGGSAITGYKITAYKLNRRNATVRTYTASVGAGISTVQVGGLAKGRYKLVVQALNSAGTSAFSATSGVVTAR